MFGVEKHLPKYPNIDIDPVRSEKKVFGVEKHLLRKYPNIDIDPVHSVKIVLGVGNLRILNSILILYDE